MCIRKLRKNVSKYLAVIIVTFTTVLIVYPSNNSLSKGGPGWYPWIRKFVYLALVARRPVHIRLVPNNDPVTSSVNCDTLVNQNMTEIQRCSFTFLH